MLQLVASLRNSYPKLQFEAGESFHWSPEQQIVFYKQHAATNNEDKWSLLHETGHALLGHKNYEADFELLQLEVAAWQKAKELAEQFEITIDEDHIQDCLDSYRDWLHARSLCPTCGTRCLQAADITSYRCHNCHSTWKVTSSRFTRPYRSSQPIAAGTAILFVE